MGVVRFRKNLGCGVTQAVWCLRSAFCWAVMLSGRVEAIGKALQLFLVK